MIRSVLLLLFLIISVSASSGNPKKPVSEDFNRHFLFKIERSRDANYLIYSLNFDDSGEIVPSEPIRVYWKNPNNPDFMEPITPVQQKYGYGVKILDYKKSEQTWSFQLVSYPDKTFRLKKTGVQSFKVTTTAGNQEIIVKRIYIRFENNSFWFPLISSVELYGNDLQSEKQLTETLKF